MGLLDSGADTTCFSPTDWPPDWPTTASFDSVSGVAGTVKQVLISANKLVWQDEDGDTGLVRPYIIPDLPINLWGRDIMEQMGVYIIKCRNPAALAQMMQQGYTPSKGLGRNL
ncbi:endogenous retrovirus group K member 25 Pro protein-like [Suncus etruscus]|uniref:endogenous retrovirus group K member 25 Pro protein-like n=1 Tax=Suncus etruscus TaxID=109475 RepID=UPI0021103D5E|nr:endogenous retrovirus group K member 25 Pro protein-like [Suncus etruscus]